MGMSPSETEAYKSIQRFDMVREGEVVAMGVRFLDGTCILRWRGENPGTIVYDDFDSLAKVHHVLPPEPTTAIKFADGVCWACGRREGFMQGEASAGGQCWGCSSSWDGPPSWEAEPGNGTWKVVASIPAREEEPSA